MPRLPSEIVNGNGFNVLNGDAEVLDSAGDLLTKDYISGARLALKLAHKHSIKIAVLTDGSPSCGSSFIYNGSFSNAKRKGDMGVTAALLCQQGIEVFNQYQLSAVAARFLQLD